MSSPKIVVESTDTSGVDIDAESRIIPIMGLDAIRKLKRANVLICGLDGLGVEIAKNIILFGPGRVTVHDSNNVKLEDLSSQFFLSEGDIGKNRAEVCLPKLKELNTRSCKVSAHTGELTEDFIRQFRAVVLVNSGDQAEACRIGDICHSNKLEIPSEGSGEAEYENTIFIVCDSRGVFARVFSDFGENHKILDSNGNPPKTRIVSSISRTKKEDSGSDSSITKVVVHEDDPHGFADGDFVKFHEVQGMGEINSPDAPGAPPKIFKVKETKGLHGLELELDSSEFGEYRGGGLVTQVKVEKSMTGRPYSVACRDPGANSPIKPVFHSADWAKEHHNAQYFIGWQALYEFQRRHGGSLPEVANEEHVGEVVAIAKELNDASKAARDAEGEASTILVVDEVDASLIAKMAEYARGDIVPMAAFIGGIVGQEVLKLTGKFTPIHQWFFFDAVEVLDPEGVSAADRKPLGTRYDGQIAVIGRAAQERLASLRVFMIGAGALGCEFLKNYAMMGVATRGKFTVTDMDNIEISNLTRQFLFRDGDVNAMKAPTAAAAAAAMNPEFAGAVEAQLLAVGPDNEDTYDEAFWNGLDIVVNAVDNVKARLYVDSQCVFYNKCLLESGTLGTAANSQVVFPKLTESYGSSRDPEEKSIPMCTLKNFPNQIEHCIEWARDKFGGLFTNAFDDANNWVESPEEFIRTVDAIEAVSVRKERLQSVVDVLTLARGVTFEACVGWARKRFEEYFNNIIQQLLFNFPPDAKTSNGADFWSGPKRPPTPLTFNPEDREFHGAFIEAAANLIAHCYRVEAPGAAASYDYCGVAGAVDVAPFAPSAGVRIKAGDEDETEEGTDTDEADVDALKKRLAEDFDPAEFRRGAEGGAFESAAFEKDDDNNYHVAFMTHCANLRALNYAIPTTTFVKTKSIAGRITPAIATTTAMITGAVGLEFYKAIRTLDKGPLDDLEVADLERFRNTFVNLALPVFVQSEPMPCEKMKSEEGVRRCLPEGWSLWDKFVIDEGDITFQQLLDWWEDNHDLAVVSITCGSRLMYNEFFPAHKARLPLKISEYVKENVADYTIREGQSTIKVVILLEDPEDEDLEIELPDTLIKFK